MSDEIIGNATEQTNAKLHASQFHQYERQFTITKHDVSAAKQR